MIDESTDKHFPSKQVERHIPKQAWITNRIKKEITNRDKLYRIWIRSKAREDFEKYRKERNEVNMEIKIAKRNDVQDKPEQNNPNDFFKFIKQLKGSGNREKKCNELPVDDFNNYFISTCDTKNTILTQNWKL